MFVQRYLEKKIRSDLFEKKKSVLLLGPRQTGKSSLFKMMEPDLYINLAKESEYQRHIKDTGLIEKLVLPLLGKNLRTVFIDEIQRIPGLVNTVQALIDDHKNIIFLISGSSARMRALWSVLSCGTSRARIQDPEQIMRESTLLASGHTRGVAHPEYAIATVAARRAAARGVRRPFIVTSLDSGRPAAGGSRRRGRSAARRRA